MVRSSTFKNIHSSKLLLSKRMETLFSIENVPMETVLEFLGFNNGNDLRWQHSVCLVMNDENLNLGEFKARIYMNQTILEEKQTKELDKQDT